MTPIRTTSVPAPVDWASLRWPIIVVALLAGHAIVVTGGLVLSSTLIPAASVVPSGYAEALRWDDLQSERAASTRLGWTATVTPAAEADLMGRRSVGLVLRDADGAPVAGATLEATLYHYAHADEPVTLNPPATDANGAATAVALMRRPGQWRLSGVATRGSDRLLIETDVWAPEPGQTHPGGPNE